jgi:hypothetical protein
MIRKSLAFQSRIETMGSTATECESLTIDAGSGTSSRGETDVHGCHIRREVVLISRIEPMFFSAEVVRA